jgi:hypothetical protein
MLLSLAVPADNTRSPRYMEKALAAIHQSNGARVPIVLQYANRGGQVGLFVDVPDTAERMVCDPLLANYPQASLTRTDDAEQPEGETWSAALRLEPDLFPILRYAQFDDGNRSHPGEQ